MKKIILIYLLLPLNIQLFAQINVEARYHYLSSGLKQIKESANFGLVFSGPALNYGYFWSTAKNKNKVTIENELGLAVLFSHDIPALDFYLKLAEVSYLFNVNATDFNLLIGPMVKFEYNYNLYPDLQSGFDYWFTNFSLGLNSVADFKIANKYFKAKLKTTLLGFTSRQPSYRDPYFYDIGFTYAINHLHSNMGFYTVAGYNQTSIELLWKFKEDSRCTWAYVFNYSGYYGEPKISILSHNVKLIIAKKQKSK
jgi:hypothetical protein